MNDSVIQQSNQLVLRRLNDNVFEKGIWTSTDVLWLAGLGAVLFVAFFYVVWMYVKDSRSVGAWWGTFLGTLRSLVYLVLAAVFLLPGCRTWQNVLTETKIVAIFDVSGSMETKDDQADDKIAFKDLKSRQDKVLDFLKKTDDKKLTFFARLQDKNPVTVYRFGAMLDESMIFVHGRKGGLWTREQYEAEVHGKNPPPKPQQLPPEFFTTFLKPIRQLPQGWSEKEWAIYMTEGKSLRTQRKSLSRDKPPAGWNEKEWVIYLDSPPAGWNEREWDVYLAKLNSPPAGRSEKEWDVWLTLLKENEASRKKGLFNGTNLEAVNTAFNREVRNMVNGIVVFTDGRMHRSSDFYAELQANAKKRKVPIFVVGVGSINPKVRIDIPSIQAPKQVQPDDKFRVLVDVLGDGLAEQDIDITLDVWAVRKVGEGEKQVETPVTLEIQEMVDKSAKVKERPETITILDPAGGSPRDPKKLTLKLPVPPKFNRSALPRAEVEFVIDAAMLAKAAGKEAELGGKRWEIVAPEDANEQHCLRVQARVPRHKMEIFEDPEHKSKVADVRVFKKKLSVLLLASAPTRDYQFCRTLLVREMEKERAELCVHLQLPPGRSEPRKGVVQDVEPERLLTRFPDRLGQKAPDKGPKVDKKDIDVDQFYDLSYYDVILAFDPDWSQLSEEQINNIHKWVTTRGGGLVLVGGPINTVQLASPGSSKITGKLAPLAELLPIVLDDIRLREYERKTDEPYELIWDSAATPDMEFLRLAEAQDKEGQPLFLKDWEEFWGRYKDPKDNRDKVTRGFYNFYPVDSVKTGSLVVARFADADPKSKLKDNTFQPFICIKAPGGDSGGVVWIGSGEMWRLRAWRETWNERFWIKLARYAGSTSIGKISKRITALMDPAYNLNRDISINFTIYGEGGVALTRPRDKAKFPTFKLRLPKGVEDEKLTKEREMKFKADGMWSADFTVPAEGPYFLTVNVPETNDTETFPFKVEDISPEKDDVRPDYEAMARLASTYGEIKGRLSESQRQVLKQKLYQSQRGSSAAVGVGNEDSLKLVFDLSDAELIPDCTKYDFSNTSNRGGFRDLWDEGFVLWGHDLPRQQQGILPYVLVIVVGLLSIEWLTRKLLRLA